MRFRMQCWILVINLLIVSGCAEKTKSNQSEVPETPVATSVADTGRLITKTVGQPTDANGNVAGSDTWQYSKTTDKEGRSVFKASIISPTPLEFEFPYNGGSVAMLTIRKRADDTHVYIQVSKGQFNRSFQEGKARVRFDGNSPVTYSFSAAENGSANVIFFDSERALINKMKAARKMLIDVEFAGQGSRQIAFKTAGLKWNHY